MYKLAYFVVLLSLICLSQGVAISNGCPEVETVTNFKFDQFGKGEWHEVARYPNNFELTNCWSFEYVHQGDKVQAKIIGAADLPEDSPKYLESSITLAPDAGDKGELRHDINYGYPRKSIKAREYILALDYDKYYIGYDCSFDEKTNTHQEYAWVVSRTREIDSDVRAAIDKHIKSSKILDASKFIWLKNEHCQ